MYSLGWKLHITGLLRFLRPNTSKTLFCLELLGCPYIRKAIKSFKINEIHYVPNENQPMCILAGWYIPQIKF